VVGLGPMIILTCGFDKCVAEKEEVGAMVVLCVVVVVVCPRVLWLVLEQ